MAPEPISKTRRKKQMLNRQKLGERLLDLADARLAQLGLPEVLLDAIAAARTTRTREGKRRQLQYVGRLMRAVDPVPIETALERIASKDAHIQGRPA